MALSGLKGLNQNNSYLNTPLEDLPSTRVAYSTLPTNNVSPPTSENRILNYGFSKESIHKVYTLPFLITKDSKLIAFQFKIIRHILPTKSSLFRLTSRWYQKLKQVVSLTESNILYGWHNNIKNKQALNVTLLIAKFHIFATSSYDRNLCFEGFLLHLQDKLDILKQSYIAQRKLHKFLNIWEKLL